MFTTAAERRIVYKEGMHVNLQIRQLKLQSIRNICFCMGDRAWAIENAIARVNNE